MLSLAPEYVWGIAAMILGACIVFAFLKVSAVWTARAMLLSYAWWQSVGIFHLIGAPFGVSFITCFCLAAYSMYYALVVRIKS
jgi:hypothetical protein